MKETIETAPFSSTTSPGKIINLSEAAALTNGFSIEVTGKTHVSFNAAALREFIQHSGCTRISFRYCTIDKAIALIALPLQASETEDFEAMCSGNSQRLTYAETLALTDNFSCNFKTVQKHIFSAALVVQVLNLCPDSINIFFGENSGMPALVFVPDNISAYFDFDEVCLDYGELCPPSCM
jgi:hypothetical protein